MFHKKTVWVSPQGLMEEAHVFQLACLMGRTRICHPVTLMSVEDTDASAELTLQGGLFAPVLDILSPGSCSFEHQLLQSEPQVQRATLPNIPFPGRSISNDWSMQTWSFHPSGGREHCQVTPWGLQRPSWGCFTDWLLPQFNPASFLSFHVNILHTNLGLSVYFLENSACSSIILSPWLESCFLQCWYHSHTKLPNCPVAH